MVDIVIHPTAKTPEWHEQFGRMLRWHERFISISKDGKVVDMIYALDVIYAFFQNCYHLKDWVKSDVTISQKQRDGVEAAINQSHDMILCDCLANGTKHKTLYVNKRRNEVKSVEFKSTIALTIVADNTNKSKGKYIWELVINGTEVVNGLSLADRCVKFWQEYLKNELQQSKPQQTNSN